MNILFLLIAVHFVADYPLQSNFVAQRKSRKNNLPAVPWYYVMAGHAFTHGLGVALVTGVWWLGLAETVVHFIIDMGKCEGWTGIHTDQGLHILCKLVWFLILIAINP